MPLAACRTSIRAVWAGFPAIDRALDPELVERFRADLARISVGAFDDGKSRLGIAVSGGPDSLALLLLAHAVLPGRVEAATVDHRLRDASASEARQVAGICENIQVPHAILPVGVPPGNMQAQARAVRYDALTAWASERGLGAIATAHHADDQAETFLMRLNRGSGVAGLAGIRAFDVLPDKKTVLFRPLLSWRHAELVDLVCASPFDAVDDPSNYDSSFDRVRMRQALAGADWLDVDSIARSAAHMADADQALGIAALHEMQANAQWGREEIRYTPQAPKAVRLRIAEMAIASFAGGEPRGRAVAALVERLEAGEGGNVAGVLVTSHGGKWIFRPEPPRHSG